MALGPPGPFPGAGTADTPLSCRRAREYLAAVARNAARPSDPAAWPALRSHGVLAGAPDAPEITPIGRQVLHELEVRADRTDPRPLEEVAEEIGRWVGMLDGAARRATYFLAELGNVPPVEVVGPMRAVAVGLSVHARPPEDLVERFKAAWGAMEVIEGTSSDRLLAASLLTDSPATLENMYAPLTSTVDSLREAGCRSPIASAAILHLFPEITRSPALDRWSVVRQRVPDDEAAALLAGPEELAATLVRYEELRTRWDRGSPDARWAAAYLAVAPGGEATMADPVLRTLDRLPESVPAPLLAATIAVHHLGLEPPEVADWFEKALFRAGLHGLAPNRPELAALAVTLLLALPGPRRAPGSAGVLALTALEGWLHRSAVRPSPVAQAASPPPA
jgi:hypothetical protein